MPCGSAMPVFGPRTEDRKSTRLNSSHEWISYAVFCLKKKKQNEEIEGGILRAPERLTRMEENYILYDELELQRLLGVLPAGYLSSSSVSLELAATTRD